MLGCPSRNAAPHHRRERPAYLRTYTGETGAGANGCAGVPGSARGSGVARKADATYLLCFAFDA